MGGEICKNCKKGIMIRKGKRTKVRCTVCGYWKFNSPNMASRGSLIGSPPIEAPEIHPQTEEKEIKKTETMPQTEEEREKMYPKDPEYVRKKALHDQLIRDQKRERSIQKMLNEIRKRNKYAKLGPVIIIEGEIFDLETGERIYKEKPMEMEKVE